MMKNKKSISSAHYIFASIIFAFSYILINQWNKYTQIQCSVSFTPYENCTQKIVDEINKANNEILVQTYSFTSKPIIEALINKHKNGKKIIIIADNSQKNSTILVKLKNYGIPIYIDKLPGIAHNKVMIIDNEIVLTGSFNFTESAQYRNAENSLIIISKTIASKYKNNFEKRLKISTEYNNLNKPIYCSNAIIINKINKAKKNIFIQTDLSLNNEIMHALINKHNNKINLIIVTNQNADKNKINQLKKLNIPIYIYNTIEKNNSTLIYIDKKPMITNNKELTNDQLICIQLKQLQKKLKKINYEQSK